MYIRAPTRAVNNNINDYKVTRRNNSMASPTRIGIRLTAGGRGGGGGRL